MTERAMSPKQFCLRLAFFSALVALIFFAVGRGMKLYTEARASKIANEPLSPELERLRPLQQRLGTPEPGSWLAEVFERGQTLEEYRALTARRPSPERQKIYILPLGPLTPQAERILKLSTEYLGLFFCKTVELLPAVPPDEIEKLGRPRTRDGGARQYHTASLIRDVIAPKIPGDSFVTIGLTEVDLYPRDDWNFVFGEALPEIRSGVWSVHRFGNPGASPEEFRRVLRRALRTASHEISHLFGLPHCITYECNLNGSMSLPEADRTPLEACPHCLQKLLQNARCDLASRLAGLAAFAKKNDLGEEEAWFLAEHAELVQSLAPKNQHARDSAPDRVQELR